MIGLAAASAAQDDTHATIENIGRATIEVPPEYVEFVFSYSEAGVNLAAGAERLLAFVSRLREGLDDVDLSPRAVEASGLRLVLQENPRASIRVRTVFDLGSNTDADGRSRMVASLSDRVKKVGAAFGCELAGPFYGTGEKDTTEQEAVARATEDALYRADAIASLMESSIAAVQRVRVLDVAWSDESSDDHQGRSDAKSLFCTARVEVVYTLNRR